MGPLQETLVFKVQVSANVNKHDQQTANLRPVYILSAPTAHPHSVCQPANMTTIGFRFEDDRPSMTQPKRSFLERLGEKQGTFIAHMRLNRGEEQAIRRQKHIEQSRTRALSSSSTLTVSSNTPSNGSASSSDRDQDSHDDDSDASPMDGPAGDDSDFSVPFQYARMPKDREQRRNIVNGMQNFMIWKQASYDSSLARPFHISPPQTPQTSHSWSSMSSTPSEMSDEQFEEWLERPIDADLHRFRKASAESNASSASSTSTRPTSSNTVEHYTELKSVSTIKRKPLPSPPAHVIEDDKSMSAPSPTELFLELAFQPHNNTVLPFCLSGDSFNSSSASSLPT